MTQVPSALTQPVPQPGGPRGAQACGRLPPTRSPQTLAGLDGLNRL